MVTVPDWLLNRTCPSGNSRKRPVKQAPPALLGALTGLSALAVGSYSKKDVGPGKEHGGEGLAARRTRPFGHKAAGASIGKRLFLGGSSTVGPGCHVPGFDGLAGGA